MKKILSISLLATFLFCFWGTGVVWADCNCLCTDGGAPVTVTANQALSANLSEADYCSSEICNTVARGAFYQSCTSIGRSNGGNISIKDPLGITDGPEELYARLIKGLLGFVGVASLVAFVYAGFVFLISAGNPERVKKAKDTMLYAVIGIAVAMASYAILSFVFKTLETATGNQ